MVLAGKFPDKSDSPVRRKRGVGRNFTRIHMVVRSQRRTYLISMIYRPTNHGSFQYRPLPEIPARNGFQSFFKACNQKSELCLWLKTKMSCLLPTCGTIHILIQRNNKFISRTNYLFIEHFFPKTGLSSM